MITLWGFLLQLNSNKLNLGLLQKNNMKAYKPSKQTKKYTNNTFIKIITKTENKICNLRTNKTKVIKQSKMGLEV